MRIKMQIKNKIFTQKEISNYKHSKNATKILNSFCPSKFFFSSCCVRFRIFIFILNGSFRTFVARNLYIEIYLGMFVVVSKFIRFYILANETKKKHGLDLLLKGVSKHHQIDQENERIVSYMN